MKESLPGFSEIPILRLTVEDCLGDFLRTSIPQGCGADKDSLGTLQTGCHQAIKFLKWKENQTTRMNTMISEDNVSYL